MFLRDKLIKIYMNSLFDPGERSTVLSSFYWPRSYQTFVQTNTKLHFQNNCFNNKLDDTENTVLPKNYFYNLRSSRVTKNTILHLCTSDFKRLVVIS